MAVGPGTRLDAYELVRPLGAGGIVEVWLARDTYLGRKVALKLLPGELTNDPPRVARFELEARAASALSHPNIAHIYALGHTANDQHYIAMELVEGETLRARLQGTRLAVLDALKIATQIASAVSAAYVAGIIHRDLKPENVMIRPDGTAKVLVSVSPSRDRTGPRRRRVDAHDVAHRSREGVGHPADVRVVRQHLDARQRRSVMLYISRQSTPNFQFPTPKAPGLAGPGQKST